MSKPTISVLYGFAEGPWQGKELCKALEAAGFELTNKPADAQILFAHSAGCFWLPPAKPEQLTVLIGPPYWPGKSMTVRFLQKIWRDFKDHSHQRKRLYWLQKTYWNCIYIIGGGRKLVALFKHAHANDLFSALAERNVIIIRNDTDAWTTPNMPKLLPEAIKFQFYTLPGQHDDCWLNPTPYVEVLQSVYESR